MAARETAKPRASIRHALDFANAVGLDPLHPWMFGRNNGTGYDLVTDTHTVSVRFIDGRSREASTIELFAMAHADVGKGRALRGAVTLSRAIEVLEPARGGGVTIRAYASRTGGERNLSGLRDAGWGLLISAYSVHRDEGWSDIMLDPGTWSKNARDGQWDEQRFIDLLDKFGERSAQTIAPDIVSGGRASLDLSLAWLDDLIAIGRPVLLAAQDGLELEDLRPHLGERVGVAVGGSTEWKWRNASAWVRLAKECNAPSHVLRAGSARMIRWASQIGADSFDTTGPSRFADALRELEVGRLPTQAVLRLDLPSPFKPRIQSYNPKEKTNADLRTAPGEPDQGRPKHSK